MGKYSYSQPSSSDEYGIDYARLLQEEADLYADEAESGHTIAAPVQYPVQPEADDGIPWWDVVVMEEMSEYQRQLMQLKDQGNECDEKLVKLEKTVGELAKKRSWVRNAYVLVVSVMVLICMQFMIKWVEEKDNVIKECLDELQRVRMRVSDL